jgi:hypothetical protein
LLNFSTANGHLSWGLHPQTDPAALAAKYDQDNRIANPDAFSRFARQDKHGVSFLRCCCKESISEEVQA